jgi:hypothetical protein
LFRTIALDIEFSGDNLFYFPYIIVPDMSFIGAGMNRDTAVFTTSGLLPPLELRSVAILLMFTESLVMVQR